MGRQGRQKNRRFPCPRDGIRENNRPSPKRLLSYKFFMIQENLNYATYHDGMNLNFGQCVDGSFLYLFYIAFSGFFPIFGCAFTIGQEE